MERFGNFVNRFAVNMGRDYRSLSREHPLASLALTGRVLIAKEREDALVLSDNEDGWRGTPIMSRSEALRWGGPELSVLGIGLAAGAMPAAVLERVRAALTFDQEEINRATETLNMLTGMVSFSTRVKLGRVKVREIARFR